jgi:hypothetical protein
LPEDIVFAPCIYNTRQQNNLVRGIFNRVNTWGLFRLSLDSDGINTICFRDDYVKAGHTQVDTRTLRIVVRISSLLPPLALDAVTQHEIGHVLGLAHTSPLEDSVMGLIIIQSNTGVYRELSHKMWYSVDDARAVRSVYKRQLWASEYIIPCF